MTSLPTCLDSIYENMHHLKGILLVDATGFQFVIQRVRQTGRMDTVSNVHQQLGNTCP